MVGRFTPQLLDEIRARISVSHVVGRKVALKKAGREWRGLSPFKSEKTPSFYVNDQKGFYHCFASSEHGDIFTFLMKTEGLDFPEAVERLAQEAGVILPKLTERSVEQDDARTRHYKVLEAAAIFFESSLRSPVGSDARRYVEKRGLSADTLKAFRIGYAPGSRHALRDHLKAQGFTLPDMIATGMLIAGDDIPEPYDRFRNRVMFPITDLKARVIAFGGRALDKDAPAKYLNSPETPLFHKGHNLFNAARARPLAHDRDRIIAVEGYMDVVALTEAGFGESVAPLGTALTEDQVKLLWRFVNEPTLCFDGDTAGRKAAFRAVDTVLPHLKPGFSVSFAFLPDGLDPDDLVRQQGPQAFTDILAKTRPLIDVLWERETAAGPLDTPEQRAALEARVRGLAAGILDANVRGHYTRELRDRLYQLGRRTTQISGPQRGQGGYSSSYARAVPQQADWRMRERARLAGPGARPQARYNQRYGGPGANPLSDHPQASSELIKLSHAVPIREALILKTLLNHPWLIDEHSEIVSNLEFSSQPLSALRDEILSLQLRTIPLDRTTLATQLSKTGVAKVVDLVARTITHTSDRFAEPEASTTEVEAAWTHVVALHERSETLQRMLKAAEEALCRDFSSETEARLLDIKRQLAIQATIDDLDETQGQQPANRTAIAAKTVSPH